MKIGNDEVFAIESDISQAFERVGFRALGFFVVHVGGRRYGVRRPDATMLACSFDEIGRRITNRGQHTAPFSIDADAGKIADDFLDAEYGGERDVDVLGFTSLNFHDIIYSRRLLWAPDSDAAFDDGTYILQFDVDGRVRLIAFKGCRDICVHDPSTLRDVWLPANDFYRILLEWRDDFAAEWRSMPKTLR